MSLLEAARAFASAEDKLHRTYGSTATCREDEVLIAGAAMTMHCSITCRTAKHKADVQEYADARAAFYAAIWEAERE